MFDLVFWSPQGSFGGHITLLLWPGAAGGAGQASYWSAVVEAGRPLVTIVEHDLALPRRSLELRGHGVWADHNCEHAFQHWSYGLEAFAVRLDDPDDVLGAARGERVGLGYDLEWEATAPPAQLTVAQAAAADGGYEQLGRVHGEVLVGLDSYELDGRGRRAHWWGTGSWPASGDGAPAPPSRSTRQVVGRSPALLGPLGVVERRLLAADGALPPEWFDVRRPATTAG